MTAHADHFRALFGAPTPSAPEESAVLHWLDQALQAPPSPVVELLEADEVTVRPIAASLLAPSVPAPCAAGPDME